MVGSWLPFAKTRDQLKQFEDKEDCFVIGFDPDGAEFDSSNLSLSHTSEPDLRVVAEKGKIACRDYPHPRHLCAKYPFGKTPDESHCDQTTPHKRGIRNGPKALKPVPVIVRCTVCGRVKLPHFFCCGGIKPNPDSQ